MFARFGRSARPLGRRLHSKAEATAARSSARALIFAGTAVGAGAAAFAVQQPAASCKGSADFPYTGVPGTDRERSFLVSAGTCEC